MTNKQIYIIEHLEPELFEWCIIEYRHISKIVGKENLWITSIKESDADKLKGYGKIITSSVTSLNLNQSKMCILDPESSTILSPEDNKSFDYFIFGGILGDSPPRKRTGPELTRFLPNAQTRNIGNKQMSTDNAVFVTKTILSGIPMEKIPFKDEIEITLKKGESTIFPYRYALVNGKPLVSPELIKYLKKKEDL